MIDAPARRRDLFPPQSIQSSISLPKHAAFFFQITGRTSLSGLPGWLFLLGTLFPVAHQSVATAQTSFAASREDSPGFLCPTLLATGWVSLGRESVLQISLGNVSLRQNSALGKPLRNYSLPSLEASGQEGIVWGQSPPVTKGPFRGADGVGGTPAACPSGHIP